MKKILLLIPALVLFVAGIQAQNCTTPMADVTFQAGFTQIAIQQTSQKKYDKAIAFLTNNCFSSAQLKNIALAIGDDTYRLEFGKMAWPHVTDRTNFYDVYDAFSAFSFALRLYDYVHAQPSSSTTTPSTGVTLPAYPNYAYPSTANYNGHKGCTGPVASEDSLKKYAMRVYAQPTDESKLLALQLISDQHCLGFGQVMKLSSFISNESIRLRALTYTFPRVYDQDNYQSGIVLFSVTATQNDWMTFAKNYLTPPPAPCVTTDADFKGIMDNMKAKSFPADKINVVKLVTKDRCFNVEQIRTMSKEFAFGDDKLTVFKTAYAKCNDQSNYYKLVDELAFSSEQDALRNFISNGGK